MTYGNGATETKSYNSRMQTTSQSLVKAGTVLQRYDYQYGQVNQATGAVDAMKNNGQLGRTDAFIGGTPQSPTKQWDERFSYDPLARLDVASEYRGDNGSLTWQADYDYDRYGNRTRVSGTGYSASLRQGGTELQSMTAANRSASSGTAGASPAVSAQRERTQSEPGAVATGSSTAIAQPRDHQVSLLTDQLSSKTGLTLPAALRTAASTSNSHHASRTAATNTATPQGPPVFTDDPLVPGVTIIKAAHITELRTAINQARSRASLAAASWAEGLTAGVTLIKAAHIVELRARLDEARAALGLAVASYTDPTLTVGVTTVKAVHIQELRQRVTEALESNSTNTAYDSATNRITTTGITYDAAGQTLADAMFRGMQYQYDPNGRMIWSANLDGSNPATSVYDGTGQRVQTTQASVTKRYFYDINGRVVAEYEATGGTGYGALKRLNVCAGGRLLAVDEVQKDGSKVTSYVRQRDATPLQAATVMAANAFNRRLGTSVQTDKKGRYTVQISYPGSVHSARLHRPRRRGVRLPLQFGKDQSAGRFKISARACNRFESAVVFVMAALFSNDGARPLSFASSFRFICEVSALWIAFRRAAIRSAGRPCDRSN
jgi:hypothetical protein